MCGARRSRSTTRLSAANGRFPTVPLERFSNEIEKQGTINWSQVRAKGAGVEDKAKGRMKEAAGAFTGDEEKKAEGRAQQRKGAAGEEAAQRAKTRQTEKEAKAAERERDRQRRKDKGPLGGLGDTLSGR